MTIREFQELIERIYGEKDTTRGTAGTYMWLAEEVGELSRALRRGQRENLEEEFLPEFWKHPPEEAVRAGHGGGDYWQVQDFVTAVREGNEPPIGIDQAMDMTLPGLVSRQSIAAGSTWVDVPDSRDWK